MKQEYTLNIYTENQVGLLNRIAIMFSRRKINIESLNTSPSEIESIHRFNIVINETEETVKKIIRQIEKQVDVLKAYYNTNENIIWQELALYKVPTDVITEKVKVAFWDILNECKKANNITSEELVKSYETALQKYKVGVKTNGYCLK